MAIGRLPTATTASPAGQGGRGMPAAGGRHGAEDRLAKGLGWFSIGLAVPQLLAPGRFSRLIGVENSRRNRAIVRAVGVRELGAAAGILDRPLRPHCRRRH